MIILPCGLEYDPNGRQAIVNSYVRLLHASPDASSVDVYANGSLIARNLSYRSFTEYLPIIPGSYNIRIYPTGQMLNPILATSVSIPPQSISTIAAVGRLSSLSLLTVPDPVIPITPGKAYVRFAHLSPNTPGVDITLPNGSILFSGVEFREVTSYIPVDPSTYTLQVRPTGTQEIVLTVPNIRLLPNKIYTVYAVGLIGGNPPLQVLIPLDGNTYITF